MVVHEVGPADFGGNMMMDFSNTFNTEPTMKCPKCGDTLHTDFVDNGFGPYAVQVSPYHCEPCEWVEGGCPADSCIKEKCFSWDSCQGRSINEKTGG